VYALSTNSAFAKVRYIYIYIYDIYIYILYYIYIYIYVCEVGLCLCVIGRVGGVRRVCVVRVQAWLPGCSCACRCCASCAWVVRVSSVGRVSSVCFVQAWLAGPRATG
jgi:hypothetical protein